MLRLFTPEQLDGDCHHPPDSHFTGKKGVYSFPCKVYCTTFFVEGQGEISKTRNGGDYFDAEGAAQSSRPVPGAAGGQDQCGLFVHLQVGDGRVPSAAEVPCGAVPGAGLHGGGADGGEPPSTRPMLTNHNIKEQ